jgi:hypothetical protein
MDDDLFKLGFLGIDDAIGMEEDELDRLNDGTGEAGFDLVLDFSNWRNVVASIARQILCAFALLVFYTEYIKIDFVLAF